MNWTDFIKDQQQHKYFKEIQEEIRKDSASNIIVPSSEEIFTPFLVTPFSRVKVVFIRDFPYGNRLYDDGLAFSSKTRVTAELRNIYKKIEKDLEISCRHQGSLRKWAMQGVLLLNMNLTAREGERFAHRDFDWTSFTMRVLEELNQRDPLVFVFFDKKLEYLASNLNSKHLILVPGSPEPLRIDDNFMQKDLFNSINEFLIKNNYSPINWR